MPLDDVMDAFEVEMKLRNKLRESFKVSHSITVVEGIPLLVSSLEALILFEKLSCSFEN